MGLIRYFAGGFAVACAFGAEKVSLKKEKPTSIVQRLKMGLFRALRQGSKRSLDLW